MNVYFETLISSLLQIFCMIALGYFIRKKRLMNDETFDDLSRLLLSIILPCSVVSSGSADSASITAESLIECALAVSLYYIVSLVFSYIVFSLAGGKNKTAINTTMAVFANTGFIGLPLAKILYGSEGLLYAVVYNLVYNVFLFTIGIKLLGSHSEKIKWKEIIFDPLSISSIIAVLLFISKLRLPDFIYGTLTVVGDSSVPISMIIIGGWIVGMNIKRIFGTLSSYLVCLLRLLVFPFLAFVFLDWLGVEQVLSATIVLITALPIGSLNVILAKKYGQESSYANETMILSLILSLVTIPLIMLLY